MASYMIIRIELTIFFLFFLYQEFFLLRKRNKLKYIVSRILEKDKLRLKLSLIINKLFRK